MIIREWGRERERIGEEDGCVERVREREWELYSKKVKVSESIQKEEKENLKSSKKKKKKWKKHIKNIFSKKKISKKMYLPYPQDSKKFLQKGPNRPKRALGLCRKQIQIVWIKRVCSDSRKKKEIEKTRTTVRTQFEEKNGKVKKKMLVCWGEKNLKLKMLKITWSDER